MSNRKEYKIGEVFYDKQSKKWLKTKLDKANSCYGCFFEDIQCDHMECSKQRRSDGKTVIFEVTSQRFIAPKIVFTNATYPTNCKITAALLPDTERFIVCLIENGKLLPSTKPKQHKNRGSAEKEAERLCKLYHQEFAVLQVVSAITPQEPKKEVFA